MSAATEPRTEARAFTVLKTQVGPYPKGHVFDEKDFRKHHPLPSGKVEYIEPDTYHEDLLTRLKAIGAIRDRKTQPDTGGPADPPPTPAPAEGVWAKGYGQSPLAGIPEDKPEAGAVHRQLSVA